MKWSHYIRYMKLPDFTNANYALRERQILLNTFLTFAESVSSEGQYLYCVATNHIVKQ